MVLASVYSLIRYWILYMACSKKIVFSLKWNTELLLGPVFDRESRKGSTCIQRTN